MLNIVLGEDKDFIIALTKNGRPFNLTGLTEAHVCLPGATAVQKIMLSALEIVVANPLNGELACSLSDTKSALLKVGEQQTFELELQFGTKKQKKLFVEQLTVTQGIC